MNKDVLSGKDINLIALISLCKLIKPIKEIIERRYIPNIDKIQLKRNILLSIESNGINLFSYEISAEDCKQRVILLPPRN